MAVQLMLNPSRALDSNAWPAATAMAEFYESSTTTPLTVYSTAALSVALGTVITADGAGFFPQAFVSGNDDVKAVIKDRHGNVLQTIDPLVTSSVGGNTAADVTFSPVEGNPATDVQGAIETNTERLERIETVGWTLLEQETIAEQRAYLKAAVAETTVYGGDLDSLTETGFVRLGSVTNGWSGVANGDQLMNLIFSAETAAQFGFDRSSTTEPITFRARTAGVWSAWGSIYSKSQVDTLIAALGLGVSQTWQDMIGSRAHSTTYQNSTTRPIQVAITLDDTGVAVQVSANGTDWVTLGTFTGSDNNTYTFIVPVSHRYRVNGATTVVSWVELR